MLIEYFGRAVGRRHDVQWRIAICAPLALLLYVTTSGLSASAKTPGKTYCFHGTCHRVLTLAETRRRVGRRATALASFYSHCKVDRYNPCGLTSSGAVFRPGHADNAASPIYPNGTKLLVWNPANRRAAVVRIDNAGPYWGRRTLDLSRAAADKLGFRHRGIARLVVKVIHAPTRQEATYRRHRVYAPVQGYIGHHASVDGAFLVATNAQRPVIGSTAVANVVLPVRNTSRTTLAARPQLPVPRQLAIVTLPTQKTVANKLAVASHINADAQRVALNQSRTAPPSFSNIRLPAQLVRAESLTDLALPLPQQAPQAIRRLASLESRARASRTSRSTPKRTRRPAKAATNTSRTSKTEQRKPSPVLSVKARPGRPAPVTNPKTASRPAPPARNAASSSKAGAIPQSSPTPAAAATVIARPARKWRRKYFSMNPGGA